MIGAQCRMRRDVEALGGGAFDLAVVGGGIYGVCVARDAALRGLSVALVERGDFGAATSFNSLKIIHGGFRYLQSADLRRLRESVRERRYWLWAAPHLVRPLRFVIPLGGGLARSRTAFMAALAAYRVCSLDGNRGLEQGQSIAPGQVLGRNACREQIPALGDRPVLGGVAWSDAQVIDTERLLLECLQQATDAGAVACNHVRASRLLEQNGRIHGIACEDVPSGNALDVRARVTVDATGPYRFGAGGQPISRPLVKSMNLVLSGEEADHAFGAEIPGSGRLIFVTPWRGCSIVGTSYSVYAGDPDACRFSSEDAAELLAEAGAALPGLNVGAGRVLWRQGGLLPAVGAGHGRRTTPISRARLTDHARADGRHGLISLVGEKYTTARSLAQRAVDLSLRKLGQRPRPCVAARTRLPGADGIPGAPDAEALAPAGMPRERWRAAVREGMAVTLEDLVLRRGDRVVRGRMPLGELEGAADVMAVELGWSPQRRLAEIAAVHRFAARHGGTWASAASSLASNGPTPSAVRSAV